MKGTKVRVRIRVKETGEQGALHCSALRVTARRIALCLLRVRVRVGLLTDRRQAGSQFLKKNKKGFQEFFGVTFCNAQPLIKATKGVKTLATCMNDSSSATSQNRGQPTCSCDQDESIESIGPDGAVEGCSGASDRSTHCPSLKDTRKGSEREARSSLLPFRWGPSKVLSLSYQRSSFRFATCGSSGLPFSCGKVHGRLIICSLSTVTRFELR